MALVAMTTPISECASDAPMEIDQSHEYEVRGLPTRSVTFFDTHARIIRDFPNIRLKCGTNEVTIRGLTQTLDLNSVEVEVTNGAIITNYVTELHTESSDRTDTTSISNNYGSDDSESDSSDGNDNGQDEIKKSRYLMKHPRYKALMEKIRRLDKEKKAALESVKTTQERLRIVSDYRIMIPTGNPGYPETSFEDGMKTYQSEREKAFSDGIELDDKLAEIQTELVTLYRKKRRLGRRIGSEYAARSDVKRKRRQEKRAKETRLRQEQDMRFPDQSYAITISIDVNAPSEEDERICDLTLHYVTDHAHWYPTYDMALSTATNSGTLYFDGCLINQTSETWRECNIILSTPETSSQDHSNSIPTLESWEVSVPSSKNINAIRAVMLYSEAERPFPTQQPQAQDVFRSTGQPRGFMSPSSTNIKSTPKRGGGLFARALTERHSIFGTIKRVPQRTASISGKENIDPAQDDDDGLESPAPMLVIGDSSPCGGPNAQDQQIVPFRDEDDSRADDDASTVMLQHDVEVGEPILEEMEFATTYCLPGKRSISPSLRTSKLSVARIHCPHVVFTRTVVPKHKTAVYLRAEVRNDSNFSLPKARGGTTIDGRFIGRTKLPRWAPGTILALSIGIDSSTRVTYSTPEFKSSVSSSNADGSLFTRTITVANTQDEGQGRPVQVTVLDQVPVSKDEGLLIDIVTPAGLVEDGPSVSTGASGDETDDNKSWGKAEAILKQGGEVEWTVAVNPGCAAKLSLAYSPSFVEVIKGEGL
ncbi:hypothetical protein GGS24DRAFT_181085 [Hypoxylon argillaceum]|nr:hypothetical protein GGS24DRAFT_181085 [Hypoxylon argillaceum]